MPQPWFQRGYRRMLVDMHIPDWDERFLSKYDPAEMVRLYQQAGLTSVMFYAQSHVGLCYWPTKTGKMHAGLRGRDIVGETLQLLRQAGIAACGYYSVVYNNWAYLEHPEWRLEALADKEAIFSGSRYGTCCPNNPGYRSFVKSQIEELAGGYKMDGLFIDMTFWPRICACPHCRKALRDAASIEMPQTIDWFAPDWCRYQAERERWIANFAGDISRWAKQASPGISVYHNFATAMFNWTLGLSLTTTSANDFLGADFYGDPLEQLLVSKLMNNLTQNRPVEFMTSRCLTLADHESNKSPAEIRTQALATTLFGGAMLFIDAINPDGTANAGTYAMIRKVYDEMSRYEPYLGGEPVEDVAIYYSSESKMDFRENGTPLVKAALWGNQYPHKTAVQGVCRALQRAHIPFGVITRRQLADLSQYKVVVLPNVLRMDADEVAAFRNYVRNGGRLYASRFTSLTETCGTRHKDFMLADLFGCHLEADDAGNVTYLKPAADLVAKSIAPQAHLSNLRPFPIPGSPSLGNADSGTVRLSARVDGQVLATLTLPYAAERGTVDEQNWASIHSNPPWRDTPAPTLVANTFGRGRVIYSAADIERLPGEAAERLLLALIRDLLGDKASGTADAHPCVWMSITDQSDKRRLIVGLLNYPHDLPAVPMSGIAIMLRPPAGKRFTALRHLPDGSSIDFTTDADGALRATIDRLETLALLAAEYQ